VSNAAPSPSPTRSRIPPQVAKIGDAALVSLSGLLDERFPGFGNLDGMKTVVLDLANVSFMTSFGVRQWLRAMAAVPPSVEHLYLTNCPPIIVDQLNMILNFGGSAKLVSMVAPFVCTKCGAESPETINVLGERAQIEQGTPPPRGCKRCAGPLELDEIVDSYFACVHKYGATTLEPAAAQLIAQSTTLRKQAVVPSIRPATTNPNEGTPAAPAPRAAEPSSKGLARFLPVVTVILFLLLLAAGAYILFGPR